MIIVGLIFPLLLLVAVFLILRKLMSATRSRSRNDISIQEVFQCLILFGLVIISGIGVSGLLGRLFDAGRIVAENQTDLARNITFVIIGVPLTIILSSWISKSFRANPEGRESIIWIGYLSLISITSLTAAISGIHQLLSWGIGNEPYRGASISQSLTWSTIWWLHWRNSRQMHRKAAGLTNLLIGSAIGLVITATGIGGLIGNIIERFIGLSTNATLVEGTDPMVNSSINIGIGAVVWYIYWLRNAQKQARELLWYLYVFLAGVTAGLVTAVASSSIVMYQTLVWFFGDTGGKNTSEHFLQISHPVGSAIVGLGLWWYHRSALGSKEISEVRRIYEYIFTGVSLISSSLGLLMIIVAVIEGFTPSEIATTSAGSNTLILSVTLLLVGAPLWALFWNRIQRRTRIDRNEISSPTRRIYTLMLFGIAGIAAVISIIITVFVFLDDALNNQLAWETLRKARFALAILLTNGAISSYHWSIYRNEKDVLIKKPRQSKFVLLIGPKDGEFVHNLQRKIGGRVILWETSTVDGEGGEFADSQSAQSNGEIWNVEEVANLVRSTMGEEVMILNEKHKVRAIPIHRP